jgi:glycosyltransferase involved in cell wall biosynthesis
MKLSIIIPAYNEAKTIHRILDKIKSVELVNSINKEIIIINDYSTDNTEEAIQQYILQNTQLNIQYKKHEINK